jgi:DnaD/phage-associated family protein
MDTLSYEQEEEMKKNNTRNEEEHTAAGAVFSHYQNNIGHITQTISEKLGEMIDEYPDDWIIEAIDIAVMNNARNMAYFKAILERWKTSGKDNKKRKKDKRGMFPERNTQDAIEKFKEWDS